METRSGKVKVDYLYDLASMTKSTATLPALMKLFNQGDVSLTDYISKSVYSLRRTNKEKVIVGDALSSETGLKSSLPFYEEVIDRSSYFGSLFSTKKSPDSIMNRKNLQNLHLKLGAKRNINCLLNFCF